MHRPAGDLLFEAGLNIKNPFTPGAVARGPADRHNNIEENGRPRRGLSVQPTLSLSLSRSYSNYGNSVTRPLGVV